MNRKRRIAAARRQLLRELQELQHAHVRAATREELSWCADERAQWQRAMRWQRLVTEAVAELGLRFNEWLVLVATRELVLEKKDAVSQSEVCRALGLTPMQVSVAMSALSELSLVSRGPDMESWMWRVLVTRAGDARIAAALSRIVRAKASEAE